VTTRGIKTDMLEQALTSLAFIKVEWDRNRDYIENFVPFVAECLRRGPGPETTLPAIQSALLETFGIKIPQGALKTILKRARNHGYVTITGDIYRRNDRTLASLDFAKDNGKVSRQYDVLITNLEEFWGKFNLSAWSREKAEQALLVYIRGRSASLLAATVNDSPLPIYEGDKASKREEFVISRFIEDISQHNPQAFEFLESVVKGSMLVDVLFFPDIGSVGQHLEKLEIYFDTPFLLGALGMANDCESEACRELLDLLHDLHASLRCFEHTLDEIHGVLDGIEHTLRNDIHTLSYQRDIREYIFKAGMKSSDVAELIATLDDRLTAQNIQVVPKPPHDERLGVNEEKLGTILQEEVHYRREETMQHDLDALTSIYRLRRGRLVDHFESCRAIFVTTNTTLARASNRFYREEFGIQATKVPHCIPDYTMTTLAWLKKPLKAPDLPLKKLLAECYAALNPPDALWRQYLDEIKRLRERGNITHNEAILLRFSTEAQTLLMDKTLGDPDSLTEQTISEILKEAKVKVSEPTKVALEAALRQKSEAESAVAEANRQTDNIRVSAQRKIYEIEQNQKQRIHFISNKASEIVKWLLLALLILAQVGLAIVGYINLSNTQFPLWIVTAVFGITSLLSILNLTFGTTLMAVIAPLQRRFAERLEQSLCRWLISTDSKSLEVPTE
jgi:hypothetical protein